jgi:hypothetical protein
MLDFVKDFGFEFLCCTFHSLSALIGDILLLDLMLNVRLLALGSLCEEMKVQSVGML